MAVTGSELLTWGKAKKGKRRMMITGNLINNNNFPETIFINFSQSLFIRDPKVLREADFFGASDLVF